MRSFSILSLALACLLLGGCKTSKQAADEPMTESEMTELVAETGPETAPAEPEAAPVEVAAAPPATPTPTPEPPLATPTVAEAAPEEPAMIIEHVDAYQAKALYDQRQDLVVLDVRTPREYNAGHIPGALNFDYNAPNFADKLDELDKSTVYLVHCGSGGRSARSLDIFKKEGFRMIFHLDGGLNGWKNLGNPVVPSPVPAKQ